MVYLDGQLDRADKLKVVVLNLLGQPVYQSELAVGSGNWHSSLDLTNLPAGIYTLQIIGQEKRYVGRVLRQ